MNTADVVVIGGGVIGLAVARILRHSNLKVVILERNHQLGGEASWAAAGMLAPQSEANVPSPMFDLCLASKMLYTNFAEDLYEETGIDIELRKEGTLKLAFSEDSLIKLTEIVQWQSVLGLNAELLTPNQAYFLEKTLSPNLVGALLLDDWQVENRRLTEALITSVYKCNTEVKCNTAFIRLIIHNEKIVGVDTGNEKIFAEFVINAAGSWSAQLPDCPFLGVVKPIRGQMLSLLMQPIDLLTYVLRTEEIYLIPRRDGRILVGATVEDVGYSKCVTAAGISKLLSYAIEVIPVLGDFNFGDMWAGLRPLTMDTLPMIGNTFIQGLIYATGHYRNGILLTPITADIVKSIILGESEKANLKLFSPSRFGHVSEFMLGRN